MKEQDYGSYIEDIIEHMNYFEEFIKCMAFEEFANDKKIVLSVTKCIEIVGEATKHIPDFILKRNTPQLAATGIKGIRIQLGLGSALPGSIFMRRRLGCPAACCAWVRRRSFTREKYPEVPWREMAGIRDRLVHGYFKVNLEIVWMTVTMEFPELRPMMENVLADVDL